MYKNQATCDLGKYNTWGIWKYHPLFIKKKSKPIKTKEVLSYLKQD